MLRKVHQIYGATGATFAKAMNEGQSTIGSTLWTNEHVRNAAQSAATQAAQHTVNVKKKLNPILFKLSLSEHLQMKKHGTKTQKK